MYTSGFVCSLLLSTGLPILYAWAMHNGVIDTREKYLVVDTPPMFTFGIPLTLYITIRPVVGEHDKYSLL